MNKYKENFEIILIQVLYTFICHVGSYAWDRLDNQANNYKVYMISIFVLILLINYFITTVKTKKYIKKTTIFTCIILAITNAISVSTFLITDTGMYSGIDLPILLSICMFIILIAYFLMLDLFLFLFSKKKKFDIVKNEYKYSIVYFLLLLVAAAIPFGYGFFANKTNKDIIYKNATAYINKEYKDSKIELKRDVCTNDYCYFDFKVDDLINVKVSSTRDNLEIDYDITYENKYYFNYVISNLSSRFKKDKFTIDEKNTKCTKYNCEVVVKSEMLNDSFNIHISKTSFQIYDYDFVYKYIAKLTNNEISNYSELFTYLDKMESELEENISKKYDISIDLRLKLQTNDNGEYLFNNIDITEISDLRNLVTIGFNEMRIHKVFKQSEQEEFSDYIIGIYEDITQNYAVNLAETMRFTFDYINPFRDPASKFYTEGGYLRDCDTMYLLYLRAHPLEIDKKNEA